MAFVPSFSEVAIEFASAVGTSAVTLTALLGALGLTGTSLFCFSRNCSCLSVCNLITIGYGCYWEA